MKRNSYGMTHKVKMDVPIGVHVPVLSRELIPGDIVRIEPEVLLKAVVPPVTQLTDKFKYTLEFFATPDRLTDDHFVANMSTTKTGQVKGDFKCFTLDSLRKFYGDGVTSDTAVGTAYSTTPRNFPYAHWTDWVRPKSALGVDCGLVSSGSTTTNSSGEVENPSSSTRVHTCFPIVSHIAENSGVYSAYLGTNWFGQNSLMDYLGIDLARDVGLGYKGKIRTNHISSYYMIMNFYHTNPEYQKYLAVEWDYKYPIGGTQGATPQETLHRYEVLEDEFGNGFVQPRLSGRCWRGLCIANWDNGYFSNTTVDAQRGIAPKVPVSITGTQKVFTKPNTSNIPLMNIGTDSIGGVSGAYSDSGETKFVEMETLGSSLNGSFVISDLRTALALQHFQEDAQGTYKWSDFLLRMFGTAPVDSLQDKPAYIGGVSGIMTAGEVLSTASTSGAELGEIGGKMSSYSQGKRITYHAKEHCVLQAILTIKPERNFQSGIDRQFTRINYLDMYWKQFVGIGAQAIRADEVTCQVYDGIGDATRDSNTTNWGHTDRYEEMKHLRNRVCGGCRSVNSPVGYEMSGLGVVDGHYTVKSIQATGRPHAGMPNFDKHMYAIGDSYIFSDGSSGSGWGANPKLGGAQLYSENCQNFLLCIPQLSDIFLSESELPFLCTIKFNMDMFRQIPVYTKAGIQYV